VRAHQALAELLREQHREEEVDPEHLLGVPGGGALGVRLRGHGDEGLLRPAAGAADALFGERRPRARLRDPAQKDDAGVAVSLLRRAQTEPAQDSARLAPPAIDVQLSQERAAAGQQPAFRHSAGFTGAPEFL